MVYFHHLEQPKSDHLPEEGLSLLIRGPIVLFLKNKNQLSSSLFTLYTKCESKEVTFQSLQRY